MLINIETGKEATKEEKELIKKRAKEIFLSPYSSPEQIEWAAMVYPEGLAEIIKYQ